MNTRSTNAALIELIRAEIKKRGPQSFAWFMEQALYHPQHGYYSSDRATIGRRGDYFTSVSVGPLFGQLLAVQFAEIWERLDKIGNFTIVEQGAHHGEFAHDVLASAQKSWPEFFEALHYRIVEPFPILRDRQSQTLVEFRAKVDWSSSIEPFAGVHFSNELLDAMPVHLLVSTEGGWQEKFVMLDGNKFVFVNQPISNRRLQKFAARPVGCETEINLAALDWIDDLAAKLIRGYVLAVDYGFSRSEFSAPQRAAGTLQVRAQHRHLASPFDEIGQADITAHVDWTSLVERAEALGLRARGFTDQHHFITGVISELPALPEDSKTKRALQTLLHPEMLGRAFEVLSLAKDVDSGAPLAGFKFARDARGALGLRVYASGVSY